MSAILLHHSGTHAFKRITLQHQEVEPNPHSLNLGHPCKFALAKYKCSRIDCVPVSSFTLKRFVCFHMLLGIPSLSWEEARVSLLEEEKQSKTEANDLTWDLLRPASPGHPDAHVNSAEVPQPTASCPRSGSSQPMLRFGSKNKCCHMPLMLYGCYPALLQ